MLDLQAHYADGMALAVNWRIKIQAAELVVKDLTRQRDQALRGYGFQLMRVALHDAKI